jgi:hypothetical protein
MASGALVIGYTGFGAKEYMGAESAVVVSDGDILAFCDAIESTLKMWSSGKDRWDMMRNTASEYVTRMYSPSVERKSIAAIYEEIIALEPPPPALAGYVTSADASAPLDPVLPFPFDDIRQMGISGLAKAARMLPRGLQGR